MTHALVWQAPRCSPWLGNGGTVAHHSVSWRGWLFSGIEAHHAVAPSTPVTVRVKVTYGGRDFNSRSLCIMALVVLYFTCVLIPHDRRSVHIRKMIIRPVKAAGGDVNRSQLWSSLMSWWCHRERTHHFCSTWMETLQKGVCLCGVLYIDTVGTATNVHQIRMVTLKTLCGILRNVVMCWKEGT